ncbi:MAG: transposase [Akkermansiaceae bacterium]|nr:transposase [Akkermansiaceae bacterium]
MIRTRLGLPHGRIGAIAGVHTFGDYLILHPHLYIVAHDAAGRKRLAEYLLRHPFSLQKITWNATSKTVIYRSKRHHTTKRNFQIFKAPAFIAAALLHLPPKG